MLNSSLVPHNGLFEWACFVFIYFLTHTFPFIAFPFFFFHSLFLSLLSFRLRLFFLWQKQRSILLWFRISAALVHLGHVGPGDMCISYIGRGGGLFFPFLFPYVFILIFFPYFCFFFSVSLPLSFLSFSLPSFFSFCPISEETYTFLKTKLELHIAVLSSG